MHEYMSRCVSSDREVWETEQNPFWYAKVDVNYAYVCNIQRAREQAFCLCFLKANEKNERQID